MARLSKHGGEVGRIHYATSTRAYMSDGSVLKNIGTGWTLLGKVKAGINPVDAFNAAQQRHTEKLARLPALAKYRKAMHDAAPLSKRWKLSLAMDMMPGDYDGIWSTCCDNYGGNLDLSVDDIRRLCILRDAANIEANRGA